jgi:hypothetical protein
MSDHKYTLENHVGGWVSVKNTFSGEDYSQFLIRGELRRADDIVVQGVGKWSKSLQ